MNNEALVTASSNLSQHASLRRTSTSATYELWRTLTGVNDAILCISISSKGRMIACGSESGTYIWLSRSGIEMQRPGGEGARGATTALAWVQKAGEGKSSLFYGTEAGWLCRWDLEENRFIESKAFQTATLSEITRIAYDVTSNRLAVCTRGCAVLMFQVDGDDGLKDQYGVVLKNFLPKGVAFGKFNNEKDARSLLVFGMNCGEIRILEGSAGETVKIEKIGGIIAHSEVNIQSCVYIIDNPFQGTELRALDNHRKIQTFNVPVKRNRVPRQVAFGAEDCSVIISGSDHGLIYTFHTGPENMVDTLEIDQPHYYSTTATAGPIDDSREWMVVTARSEGANRPNPVQIWHQRGGRPPEPVTQVTDLKHPAVPVQRGKNRTFVIIIFILNLAMLSITICQRLASPWPKGQHAPPLNVVDDTSSLSEEIKGANIAEQEFVRLREEVLREIRQSSGRAQSGKLLGDDNIVEDEEWWSPLIGDHF